MQPFHYHRERRTVRLEGVDDVFTITTEDGEITLSVHELEWLCQAAGPAALVQHTQRPRPIFPSPMERGA